MNLLVSIIIPTFNRSHLIEDTLNSILTQSYSNWECIIVDDGSTDDTEKIVQEYQKKDIRFQYHKRPNDRPKGANACRNYGFELSKGEYINWLDSDDLYTKNILNNIMNEFDNNIDAVVVKLEKVNLKTNEKIGENKIISNNIIEDYFVGKITYYVSGPFWKRSFLKKQENLFDETISNLDDWDFNLRMLYQQPKISYLNKPLIKYRVHDNSLSKEINKLNFLEIQSEIQTRKKHIELIKENKKANIDVLNKFIIQRYAFFFRNAMVTNNDNRFFYFKTLIINKLKMYDLIGAIKTIFAFIIYSIFGKGFKLLK